MRTMLLPPAITQADEAEACVGAITEEGSWVRPGPIQVQDVVCPNSAYRYLRWFEAELQPSVAFDSRPEDRCFAPGRVLEGDQVSLNHWPALLERLSDEGVEEAFSGERSLGLIRASVSGVYAKRSTGGRVFFRISFDDLKGRAYDWISPEVNLNQLLRPKLENATLPHHVSEGLTAVFQRSRVFLALGLTKPNGRFPGKFRGCHPLVVGVHSLPDYKASLSEALA